MSKTKKNQKAQIAETIRRSTRRALEQMETENTGHLHDGWTGAALATWITPTIIRSVIRTLSPPKKERKP